ncbi:hypothetical protein CCAX7_18550 [Capsulimonas corticalis]|uniref:Calcineurin-like phosphoesterase domain-containing protein n=1 Tax=Capsulimonas corticalis TaxID=2219043 RepID=A0A402D5Q3_9BACT|nr:metallophosphoesterase [Capsulimonas corticalis]BDI29804.1 hypothetical protein CCAX7_18550 [Capsulimonas corticalis]
MARLSRRLGPLVAYIAVLALVWRLLTGPWRVGAEHFFSVVIYGFGALCGFAVAVALGTAWVYFAGPAQEWLMERFWDPPQPAAIPAAPASGPLGVIVSDLHIDTWDYAKSGPVSERQTRFLDLLATVKSNPRIDSFYLNGDLMDAPLHPNDNKPESLMLRLSESLANEQGVLLKQYDALLKPLLHLTQPEPGQAPVRRAIFQTGNHDIGVSGLRYVQPDMPDYLPGFQAAWNPSILLCTDAEGADYPYWTYIEHGHHWDPFLWLYMRYAMMDILRFGHKRREAQLVSGMQRGGKIGMGKQTIVPDEHLLPASPRGTSANHFAGMASGLDAKLTLLRYRQAARRTFREFHREGQKNIQTIVVGHTHHPDRYVFRGGQVYVNTGDWSGHTQHCAYCVIDPDGAVRGPFQWETAANAEF